MNQIITSTSSFNPGLSTPFPSNQTKNGTTKIFTRIRIFQQNDTVTRLTSFLSGIQQLYVFSFLDIHLSSGLNLIYSYFRCSLEHIGMLVFVFYKQCDFQIWGVLDSIERYCKWIVIYLVESLGCIRDYVTSNYSIYTGADLNFVKVLQQDYCF